MIITAKESNAITSGNFTSHDFGIGDPVLVLDILRNRLYKNPIRIIVQEYVANAKDAHVEAELYDMPIKVVAPTALKPELIIEDFGRSMTEDQISTIFTQYGVSTKRKSDKFVGGFGIGSKSGWSYTDSYSVVTRTRENHKIVERTYCAYIDDSGIGKISLLSTKNHDEGRTGTKIIVPVKANDFYRFNEEIRNLYSYFDFPMEVKGAVDFAKEEAVQTGDLKYYRAGYSDPALVIEGVKYACDTYQLKTMFPHCEAEVNRIVSFKMIPCLKNSDVDISPDRSSIQLTKKTADALVQWVDKFSRKEMDYVRKQYGKETNARKLISTWAGLFASYKREYLEELIKEKFPQIDMEIVKEIFNKVSVIQGQLFDNNRHYVYSRIDDEGAFPTNSTLVTYDARQYYSAKFNGIKDVRKEIEKILGYNPIKERVKGGRGKIPTFYVRSNSWKARNGLIKEKLDYVKDNKEYYVLRDKHNTYDFGDGVLRSPSWNRLPNDFTDKIVIVAPSFKTYMEDELNLKPAINVIKDKVQEVIDHHKDPSDPNQLIIGWEGYIPYQFEKYRKLIPEIQNLYAIVEKRQEIKAHPWLVTVKEFGFLAKHTITKKSIQKQINDIEDKYPLLFGSRGTNYEKHLKKYIDNVNEDV